MKSLILISLIFLAQSFAVPGHESHGDARGELSLIRVLTQISSMMLSDLKQRKGPSEMIDRMRWGWGLCTVKRIDGTEAAIMVADLGKQGCLVSYSPHRWTELGSPRKRWLNACEELVSYERLESQEGEYCQELWESQIETERVYF